jgi:gamma-glutamyl-gamma-aminobutyrate hydrolase PuuD
VPGSIPRPLIGCSVGYHDFGDYQGVGFQRPLALAGGVPLILSRVEGTIDHMLDALDAVVIGGGRDIEPHRYGQEPHDLLGDPDPHRDEFELELVERTIERGLPLLGMCRGIQVINVALGGTLVQDLSLNPDWEQHPTDRGWHRWKEVERASLLDEPDVPEHPRHEMTVAPGSRLHAALGVEAIGVDSFHHQAIDELGEGLVVTGRAEDGVVEVIELEDASRYLLGAQFELQEEWRVDPRFLEIFRQLVSAAAEPR